MFTSRLSRNLLSHPGSEFRYIFMLRPSLDCTLAKLGRRRGMAWRGGGAAACCTMWREGDTVFLLTLLLLEAPRAGIDEGDLFIHLCEYERLTVSFLIILVLQKFVEESDCHVYVVMKTYAQLLYRDSKKPYVLIVNSNLFG